MAHGYIYILSNVSLNGLVKIGSTVFHAAARAKQLSSTTAIPTPFVVAYEAYVNHYQKFEKELHHRLSKYRVNPKREFFKISVESVVKMIIDMMDMPLYKPQDQYEAIEILPELLKRYQNHIDAEIVSARIYQESERVYFETTKDTYIADELKDQDIHREDLGFIAEYADKEHDAPVFHAADSIEINVKKFLELDDISMVNCFGQLFVPGWAPCKSCIEAHAPDLQDHDG